MPQFFVIVNVKNEMDSFANLFFDSVLELANFDQGTEFKVILVQARDVGEARLPYKYKRGLYLFGASQGASCGEIKVLA